MFFGVFDDGHALQVQIEFGDALLDYGLAADEDRNGDFLVGEDVGSAQDFDFFAFGEHYPFGIALSFVDYDAHDALQMAETALELFPVFVEIDGFARNAGVNGGLGDGPGFAHQDPRIEGRGNEPIDL